MDAVLGSADGAIDRTDRLVGRFVFRIYFIRQELFGTRSKRSWNSSKGDMRARFGRIVGLTIALLALGSIFIASVRGQQSASNRTSSAISTNWLGYLVVGGYPRGGHLPPFDPMPGTTRAPMTVTEVEVGLRSDGFVVWREAATPK